MRNSGLEEAQDGIKIAGRNISNLRYADDTTLMSENEEELKSRLMKVNKNGKAGLKLNIQKAKITASGPITSWQLDGETVADFIFGGSNFTVDVYRSHEIKSHLLLRRKVLTNLDSILKSRDLLPTNVRLVKAIVFPVVMYVCESWTIKKAEGWRIDAFELWCWRRLLRVPWTARRSNQCWSPAPVARDSTWRDEQCRRWEWDSLSVFYGLPVYFKFKILFYTFIKTLGQRFGIFSSPSPWFIISTNHCCSSEFLLQWFSALLSITYLL